MTMNSKGQQHISPAIAQHAANECERLRLLNAELLAALNAWEHWYSVNSTEFNRDVARENGLIAIAKAQEGQS
mgnify:FL=1